MGLRPSCRIALGRGFHFIDEGADLDSFRRRRPAQGVLMENVKGHREKIGFGASDRFVVIDTKQA